MTAARTRTPSGGPRKNALRVAAMPVSVITAEPPPMAVERWQQAHSPEQTLAAVPKAS